tara:strand:+ start:190007 stop:190372 length:366 start_codon:yes stop_codon:yes gene_type:complete
MISFPDDYPHKWQLVSVLTGLSNTSVSGDQLPYFEEYIFNSDNTFSKTRVVEKSTIVATGSFSVDKSDDKISLSLSYNSESEIIDNCSKELTEILLITSSKSFSNNVLACDRGRMNYSRVD